MPDSTINLYLDANIWLSFYELPKDELEELRKLAGLIKRGVITLYLPAQTEDEFNRRRDDVIAAQIDRIRQSIALPKYPLLAEGLDEREAAINAGKTYNKAQYKL